MNREQKRKENKKNKKIENSTNISNNNEVYRLLKICVVVIIIFAILYLIVGIFITKEIELFKDKESDNETTSTTTNAILANSIFNQKEEEYYVYFYDFNNENTNIATSIVNLSSSFTVYKVDTSDILNKNFVVEENSNKNATNLDELKVTKDTIIKVSNDKIVEYYEGEEEITNKLS